MELFIYHSIIYWTFFFLKMYLRIKIYITYSNNSTEYHFLLIVFQDISFVLANMLTFANYFYDWWLSLWFRNLVERVIIWSFFIYRNHTQMFRQLKWMRKPHFLPLKEVQVRASHLLQVELKMSFFWTKVSGSNHICCQ